MTKPDPQLEMDRDWKTLHRINSYLYDEYMHVAKPSQFFWNWKAYRRWRKLGVTLGVMHALSKELRHRGQLTSPTMFTPPDAPDRAAVEALKANEVSCQVLPSWR